MRVRSISIASGQGLLGPIERAVEAQASGTTEVVDCPTPEAEPTVITSEIFDQEGGGGTVSPGID